MLAHQYTHFLDEVSAVRPKRMAADDKPRRIGQEFEHTFGLVLRQCFAVGPMKGLMTLVGDRLLLTSIFRKANRGGFWIGKDSRRHNVESDRVGHSKDAVDHMESLHGGGVGQHLPTVDIANGVDTLHGSLKMFIDCDS